MTTRDEQTTYRVVFGALFGVVPVAIALIVATVRLGGDAIPIWLGTAALAWLISKGAIGDAIAARIREGSRPAELPAEALAELDDLRAQLAELQERQDFTERLVAQQREAHPLPAGELR